jgi:hypothetical protein
MRFLRIFFLLVGVLMMILLSVLALRDSGDGGQAVDSDAPAQEAGE